MSVGRDQSYAVSSFCVNFSERCLKAFFRLPLNFILCPYFNFTILFKELFESKKVTIGAQYLKC